jgi:hypothetical protein
MNNEMMFEEVNAASLDGVIGGGKLWRRIKRKLKIAIEALNEGFELAGEGGGEGGGDDE